MSRRKFNKRPKLHIKRGDQVMVISGEEKGKDGRVLRVISKKHPHRDEWINRVIVEGLNVVTKHNKPDQNNPQGSRSETEAGIHISNVMLVDPKTKEPTRVGRTPADKGWVRVSKKTNEIIK